MHMELNDDTWHLVKETPRVMGFIGGTAEKPAPITDKEAGRILQRMEDSGRRQLIKQFMSQERW